MTETSIDPYAIAIIAASCRFPGATTPEAFWDMLVQGESGIRQLSEDELAGAGVSPDVIAHPDYVRACAAPDGVEDFDAAFFGLTPREAAAANPQQRLFLECAWEALERAGYDVDRLGGSRVGVFAGAAENGYLARVLAATNEEVGSFEARIANDADYLATRTAYKLDLDGPAVSVQTACSTSLVAAHLACQSLLNRECDMALAGGAAILLPVVEGYLFVEGSINAPDGHCRAFSDQAQGTVPGSGAGIVLFKRLADAVADGDPVLAVVRGSAINNDGANKVGFTAPSVEGQAGVIAEALAAADVDPETIGYVETHGTGTVLGDPIEIAALSKAFGGAPRSEPCRLGAVKTAIGHLGAAAGVAGLIKTAMVLRDGEIPPVLHFERPNPQIPFRDSPFEVVGQRTLWPRQTMPRRAGVSSFGIGGTNAHMVLEEAPALPDTAPGARPWRVLPISAQTPDAITAMTERLAAHLTEEAAPDFDDSAYTLQVGRKRLKYGRVIVARTAQDAAQSLRAPATLFEGAAQGVAFLFSGQGAQHVDMGRGLYEDEPVYRTCVDRCAALLQPSLGLDLRTLMYPAGDQSDAAAAQLGRTEYAQPALFVTSYAMAQLWMHQGVEPVAMLGHSIGEYVAACLAGVFSLEDALTIVAARGRLMQTCAPGDMLATALDEAAARAVLADHPALDLAAINGPAQTVFSGPADAIAALRAQLDAKGMQASVLRTSHAFHSAMMEPALDAFEAVVRKAGRNAPLMPFLSNVTGDWITPQDATDPAYWARHLRQPVAFSAGLAQLHARPDLALLEVGPGQALTGLALAHPDRPTQQIILPTAPRAADPRSASQTMLEALGRLHLAGLSIAWDDFHDVQRRRVALPTYPFQRERHWIEAETPTAPVTTIEEKQPLDTWLAEPIWREAPLRGASSIPQDVLIFADVHGLGAALAATLRSEGAVVTLVTAGNGFEQTGPDAFILDPADEAGYTALIGALRQAERIPEAIVHLWGLAPGASAQDRRVTGFESALLLARALGAMPAPHRLLLVGDSLCAFLDTVPDPVAALLAGVARVIGQEVQGMTTRCIDVLPPSDETRVILAGLLRRELASKSADDVLAYRGRHRWAQDWASLPAEVVQPSPVFASDQTYALVGNDRAAMAHLATAMARRAPGLTLALITPPGATLDDSALAPARETAGAVMVLNADLGNRAAVDAALAGIGSLAGVLYVPQAINDGVLALKDIAATRAATASGVDHAAVLAEALKGREIGFLALCSSTIALTGGIGQVDECAAFMAVDALAQAAGGRTMSINWPLWAWDARYEQSMADFMEVRDSLRLHRETFGITADEALDVLERALSLGAAQVLVAPAGVDAVMAQRRSLTMGAVVSQLEDRAEGEITLAAAGTLEAEIAAHWAAAFGVESIDTEADFFAMGGHSLLSIQLVSRLRTALQWPELPLSALYDHPTVSSLAMFVRQERDGEEVSLEDLAEADDAMLAAMLAEIEGLSDHEVAAALTSQTAH